MIELRNISKAFGSKVVLNGVTCAIPTGKTTCVIGRSGCGKSVLLKHIVGLLHADSGSVMIDGRDIESMSKADIFAMRRSVGYVFQGAALFDSLSVFDNVVIGLVEHGENDNDILANEGRRVLSPLDCFLSSKMRELLRMNANLPFLQTNVRATYQVVCANALALPARW